MKDTYNGWANYETWRIQLEVIDGMTLENFGIDLHEADTGDFSDVELVAENVSQYVDEFVLGEIPNGLARDLAASFLDRVDWVEIAEHLIEDAR
jgi:hypothetical protein